MATPSAQQSGLESSREVTRCRYPMPEALELTAGIQDSCTRLLMLGLLSDGLLLGYNPAQGSGFRVFPKR